MTFSLDLSDALEILIRADSAPEFTQLEFIRTLRALDVNPATIAIFRRLDFKVVMAAEGEFQHGKDRMGKSIAAEVKGTAEIPEELMISVPVYSNRGERDPVEILCQIDLDAQRSAIHFRPKGDELDIAVETAQASIAARLVEAFDDTSVSYGSP